MNFSPLNAAPDAVIKRQIDKDPSIPCSRAIPARRNKPGLRQRCSSESEFMLCAPGVFDYLGRWSSCSVCMGNLLV